MLVRLPNPLGPAQPFVVTMAVQLLASVLLWREGCEGFVVYAPGNPDSRWLPYYHYIPSSSQQGSLPANYRCCRCTQGGTWSGCLTCMHPPLCRAVFCVRPSLHLAQ